ncbi:hypothetical protein LCGC14_0598280 [marine sediment metagenome]|uniref:Uncharacterized protein n=1 Tax=marine sediment metagenome TaxID=412755 RepID=A0A0F9RGB3_9ZZZZ
MNYQQISEIYDSFPENQQNIPKAEFVKRALATQSVTKGREILNVMLDDKKRERVQRAVIDSAITRGT